ncbi:hypothetical protein GCM10007855_06840 [Aliivibrio sifiae]|uniref:Uncharacterized protein n=1 Tax=Aliivibrio sifiae TaxID=566293 RepID=A0ABQ6ABD6_9GAMM|nr:hypothetical protein GCM10007855_06840 [Aliivibrio sifiae]
MTLSKIDSRAIIAHRLDGADSMLLFEILLLSYASHMMKVTIADINIKGLNYVRRKSNTLLCI